MPARRVVWTVLFALLGLAGLALTAGPASSQSVGKVQPSCRPKPRCPSPTPSPTPSPSPTPDPTPPPADCAYPTCFPGSTNTGVPDTVVLSPHPGDLTVGSGETVDGMDVDGVIRLAGTGIVVRNSRARGLAGCPSCSASVTDSTFDARGQNPGLEAVVVQFQATLVLSRVDVAGWSDLLRLDGNDLTLTDSWLHGIVFQSGAHADTIQYYNPGAGGNVVLTHNDVDVRAPEDKGNAALFLADSPAGLHVTASQSRWAGGGYSIRLHDATSGSRNVYDFHDNIVIKDSYTYGPCNTANSIPFDGTSGYLWTGNTLSDGSTVAC